MENMKSVILIEMYSKRRLKHYFGIICVNYGKIIDKKHEIVDTTFVY